MKTIPWITNGKDGGGAGGGSRQHRRMHMNIPLSGVTVLFVLRNRDGSKTIKIKSPGDAFPRYFTLTRKPV